MRYSFRSERMLMEQRDSIQTRLAELRQLTDDAESKRRAFGDVKSVLETLRQNVRAGFTFEEKKRIVEALDHRSVDE